MCLLFCEISIAFFVSTSIYFSSLITIWCHVRLGQLLFSWWAFQWALTRQLVVVSTFLIICLYNDERYWFWLCFNTYHPILLRSSPYSWVLWRSLSASFVCLSIHGLEATVLVTETFRFMSFRQSIPLNMRVSW